MRVFPRRFWAFVVLFLVVANLPYAAGYINAPDGGAFTGNPFGQTSVDYNSHLANMQLGLRGDWHQHFLFTPEDHPGLLLKTFYIMLGHVARLAGLSLVGVYHLARVLFTVVMLAMIRLFVIHYIRDEQDRWLAFFLAVVVGGAGWLLYFIIPSRTPDLAPVEFWLLDAYTFLAALTFPHFTTAIAGLLGFSLLLEDWLKHPSWRVAGWLSLCSLLIGSLQPFDLLITALLVAVLSLSALWKRRIQLKRFIQLVPVAGIHVAVVVYDYVGLHSHPVWESFVAQNRTLSPPPVYYLFAYVWLLVPAAIGVRQAWTQHDRTMLLPVLWIGMVVVLLYAPLPTQRRFLMGVQVPLAVLASIGLARIRRDWLTRGRSMARWRILLTTGLSLSALTHVLFVLSGVILVNPESRPLLFISADELVSYDWLDEQLGDPVIFSTFQSGGKIAGFTGTRVYVGHWIETKDFDYRQEQLRAFFAEGGMNTAERQNLLRDATADYLWYDPSARKLGVWDPDSADFLQRAFEVGDIVVYEVLP